MATTRTTVRPSTVSTANMTAAEQIAYYRASARALRGTPAGVKASTPLAISAGKAMAASRNFFTIAADTYATERAPYLD